ncbi:peptidylprolyl isomerase [Planctomonas sp. JC2975]|uniref:FKBP-type peptidyl-prolyl cis-trans isomerase n=1 Tax=Planctomonas sp. JC2975 TaxID=2729626 RepID=UPI0014759DF4|nr:FKBP-type peptidyl-prolyl cis-trans isomerase [Planctomonas sp. JC2975]NNC13231.1 peptidylprolyl isomerase [Planctomonas sp. JC2975]
MVHTEVAPTPHSESDAVRLKIPAVLAVSAAAALLLAGCAGSGTGASTATPSASAKSASTACNPPKSGSVSDAVKVTGDVGKDNTAAEPTVTFTKPLKATDTQRSYVSKGDGAQAKTGATVDISMVVYNGTSGAKLTSNGYAGTATIPVTVGGGSLIPGLTQAVECAPVGSRLVTTATAKDAWGGDPSSNVSSLKATDTVVFVVDILSSVPSKADGTPQAAQDGFPTVKLAASGQPTVTIPKSLKAPTETKIEELKQGDGATVADGDSVTVQYQGVNWRTGKVFDQSWGRGLSTMQTSQVIPGFTKALVGQKVGSQVLVVIPPADGYGTTGNSQAGIKGTDTLVFVIDILETQH